MRSVSFPASPPGGLPASPTAIVRMLLSSNSPIILEAGLFGKILRTLENAGFQVEYSIVERMPTRFTGFALFHVRRPIPGVMVALYSNGRRTAYSTYNLTSFLVALKRQAQNAETVTPVQDDDGGRYYLITSIKRKG